MEEFYIQRIKHLEERLKIEGPDSGIEADIQNYTMMLNGVFPPETKQEEVNDRSNEDCGDGGCIL